MGKFEPLDREAFDASEREADQESKNFLVVQFDDGQSINFAMNRQGVSCFQLATLANTLRAISDYEILQWHLAGLPKVLQASESDMRVLNSRGVLKP